MAKKKAIVSRRIHMGWFEPRTIEKSLKDFPEIKIYYKDPGDWPLDKYFDIKIRLAKAVANITENMSLEQQQKEIYKERDKLLDIAVELIKDWTLTDPYEDSDEKLPIEKDVLLKLPQRIVSDILGHVTAIILEIPQRAEDPKSQQKSQE